MDREEQAVSSPNSAPRGFSRSLMTAIAKYAAIPYYRTKLNRFENRLRHAHRIQRESLFRRLRASADSDFGRKHGFHRIHSIDDFRQRVPVCDYEYLAPYISEVSRGRTQALFSLNERILAFACTTGTTGQPKLNPVTQTWLREYLRSLEIWGVKAIFEHWDMIGTKIVQLLGPSNLGRTPSGLTIGMVSSIAARHQNPIYRSFCAIPYGVADLEDSGAKYYLTMRLAMATDVGMIVGITPANLIRLATVGHEYRQELIRDIHDGTVACEREIPPHLRRRILPTLRRGNPARARELEAIISRTGTLYPKDYWPLGLTCCWLGGTIGYQARDLSRYYGTTPTRDLGLISTEGRHTIPLQDNCTEGVLSVDGAYYEFIPVEEMESAHPRVLECHELQTDRDYSLVMTTSSGLFRYEIGDIVRCVGMHGQAPLLQFLHKTGHCADMEGEKISGFQMAQAVEVASAELSLQMDYFMAVPVRNDGHTPYYAVLVERRVIEDPAVGRRFVKIIDRELIRSNVMYAGKRNDGYIGPPRLMRLAEGTWTAHIASQTGKHKVGDSQYKQPALVPDTSYIHRFDPLDTLV